MPRPHPIRALAGFAATLTLLGVAFATAARAFGLEAGPLAALVALTPWVALGAAVGLLLALVSRRALVVVPLAALLAVQVAWQAPLYLADAATGSGGGFVVATVNLTYGEGDAGAVVDLVRSYDVDVLALEELTPEARTRLASAGLDRLLPHHADYSAPGFSGTGIWSLTPLRGSRSVPGYISALVVARTTTAVGEVTLVAAHPAAPGLLEHRRWSQELAALTAELAALPGPVLVAGDLNTTRDQEPFRRIEALGFRDAADQAGAGLRMTYPEQKRYPPVVVIDHVLARDLDSVATGYEVVPVLGSDHRGVVVSFD